MTEQERQAFISRLTFEGEIDDCDGVLMFTVKKDFDLAAAFEGVYNPATDPPMQCIDLAYCIADQMVWLRWGWALAVWTACGIICGGYSRSAIRNVSV